MAPKSLYRGTESNQTQYDQIWSDLICYPKLGPSSSLNFLVWAKMGITRLVSPKKARWYQIRCCRSSNWEVIEQNINPRPGRGVDATHPLRFFCDAPWSMRRIALIFCIAYGASFAQLLIKKNFDRVMSGHGAMTSQEVQGQAIFARNSGIWLIRRRYRDFFWLF